MKFTSTDPREWIIRVAGDGMPWVQVAGVFAAGPAAIGWSRRRLRETGNLTFGSRPGRSPWISELAVAGNRVLSVKQWSR